MNFKKLVDLDITESNVYILEGLPNGEVLINNAYDGVIFLTDELKIIPEKNISVYPELKIDKIFKKFSRDAILLVCKENRRFVHFSLHNYSFNIIPFPGDLNFDPILPIYYWEFDEVLVSTSKAIYKIEPSSTTISSLAFTEVEINYPAFYKFWNKFKNEDIIKCIPDEFVVIYQDKNEQVIVEKFNPTLHGQSIQRFDYTDLKDVAYANKKIMFMTSEILEAVLEDGEKGSFKSPFPYILERVTFVDEKTKKIAMLCHDKNSKKHDVVGLYQIEV